MSYNHFRYARRIDGDVVGLYHGSTLLAQLSKATAGMTKIYGQGTTGNDLLIGANTIDDYPKITLYGDDTLRMYYKGNLRIYEEGTEAIRFKENGAIHLLETSTPTAITNMGAIYTKNDNKLYFQDGANVEHTVTIS